MNLKFSPIKILIFLAAFVNLSSAFNPPEVGEYTPFFTFAGTSNKYKSLKASLIGESYVNYDGKIYEIVEYQSYFLYNTDIGIGIFDGGSYNGRKIFYYIPTLIKKSLYCRYPNSHYEGSFGSYSFYCSGHPVNPYSERKAAVGLYYLYTVPVATCKANENFNTQTKKCEAPCPTGQTWDESGDKCYVDCTDVSHNKWGGTNGSCVDCSNESDPIGVIKCFCNSLGLNPILPDYGHDFSRDKYSEIGVIGIHNCPSGNCKDLTPQYGYKFSYTIRGKYYYPLREGLCEDGTRFPFKVPAENLEDNNESNKTSPTDKKDDNKTSSKDPKDPATPSTPSQNGNQTATPSDPNNPSGVGSGSGLDGGDGNNGSGSNNSTGGRNGSSSFGSDGSGTGSDSNSDSLKGSGNCYEDGDDLNCNGYLLSFSDIKDDIAKIANRLIDHYNDMYAKFSGVRAAYDQLMDILKGNGLNTFKKGYDVKNCPVSFDINLGSGYRKVIKIDICEGFSSVRSAMYYIFYLVFFGLFLVLFLKLVSKLFTNPFKVI